MRLHCHGHACAKSLDIFNGRVPSPGLCGVPSKTPSRRAQKATVYPSSRFLCHAGHAHDSLCCSFKGTPAIAMRHSWKVPVKKLENHLDEVLALGEWQERATSQQQLQHLTIFVPEPLNLCPFLMSVMLVAMDLCAREPPSSFLWLCHGASSHARVAIGGSSQCSRSSGAFPLGQAMSASTLARTLSLAPLSLGPWPT